MRNNLPETLQEAIVHFSDLDVSRNYLVSLRWPDGVTCPRCQSKENSFITSRKIWRCHSCKKQFSVKVGTIFEDSQSARAADSSAWLTMPGARWDPDAAGLTRYPFYWELEKLT